MTKVTLVYEENHGLIFVCQSPEYVVDCLIDLGWLDENTWICTGDCDTNFDWYPIKEILGANWKEKLQKMDIDRLNEFFEGVFSINEERVYGAE